MSDVDRLRELLDEWQIDYEIEDATQTHPTPSSPMSALVVDAVAARGRVNGFGCVEFVFDPSTGRFDHIAILG
jgi:hypothetical protein